MDYQTFAVAKDFQIKIEASQGAFQLSDVERALIEQVWEEELRLKSGKLFNGQMLCYVRHDAHCLYGRFISYKEYIAILRRPALRAAMPIDLLGISGITLSDGAILWGKRASFVTDYAGYYECAPSGGLNPGMAFDGFIPSRVPFEQELAEETGITSDKVKGISLSRLVYNPKAHLYELVAAIELEDGMRQASLPASEEYDELLWVDISALPSFFQQHAGKILPMSDYLLTSGLAGE